MTTGVVRVAVVTNRIPSYRRPVFEALLQDRMLTLGIFLSMPEHCSDEEARATLPLHSSGGFNLKHRTYHREAGVEQVETLPVPILLPADLHRFRPDIVIAGEFGLRSLLAGLAARLRSVPLVLWTEEIAESAKSISGLQRMLRAFLLPRADAFLTWGKPAANFLRGWGIPEGRIYPCAQAVDNGYWKKRAAAIDRERVHRDLGLAGRVFLAVGRLVARKGFDRFLRAWGALPGPIKDKNSIVIVGEGEEEGRLRGMAGSLGIKNILFAGRKTREELPAYYAAADVFVFPSLVDVWGLVVNEAMACGLPVLASWHAGASQELIKDTGAGVIFDPRNTTGFTALLHRWCVAPPPIPPGLPWDVVSRLDFDVTVEAIRRCIADLARPVRSSETSIA
jgi:glycosyltransferase involved in cell wall biosynthesis